MFLENRRDQYLKNLLDYKKFMKDLRQGTRDLAFKFLPRPISHEIIRNTLNLHLPSQDSSLRFQIATNLEDMKEALRLVQENFVRAGYAGQTSSGLRITPYHFLPKTIVILVKHRTKVIATLSIISRSDFGVPLESCYDLSTFLSSSINVIELSALAVDPNYRGHHGEILYNVMKFMYHCNVDFLNAELEVIGINPNMAPLYEAILLFRNIPGTTTRSYDFVNGAPVVPLYFDLRNAHVTFQLVYGGKPTHLNLMEFFLAPLPPQFDLPKTQDLRFLLPQHTPDGLREILSWEPKLLKSMTKRQWFALESVYRDYPLCQQVINEQRIVYA